MHVNFLPPISSLLFAFILLTTGCRTKEKPIEKPVKATADEIIAADLAFSDMCNEETMKTAFIYFIDNEGILLRPYQPPLKGDQAIDYLSQLEDDGYSLSWVPEGAEIAGDGDQGFTYGIFTLVAEDTTFSGTYVNIWKKQDDGTWKFTLNSTNQGISP